MIVQNRNSKDGRTLKLSTPTIVILTVLLHPLFLEAGLSQIGAASIGDSLGNKRLPNWSHGALLTEEGLGTTTPSFFSYDRRGNVVGSVFFSIPGSTHLALADFSRATDGMVAVCGSANDAEGRTAPFVAWVNPGSQTAIVVRTTPYRPRNVTVDSDGTIWTVGFEALSDGRDTPNPNASIFRHWDRAGHLVGSSFPQSKLKDARSIFFLNYLRFARGRVAWFSMREGRYIELSLAGDVMKDVAVPLSSPMLRVNGMALTDSGNVILGTESNGKWAVLSLNHGSDRWVEIESGTANPVIVYGADGDSVVAWRGGLTGDFKFFQLSDK